MRRRIVSILGALAVLGAMPAHAPAQGSNVQILSNERTSTTVADYRSPAAIRSAPGAGRTLGHLKAQTSDKLPQVYLALKSVTQNGKQWIQIRVPGRPNGRKGWVPRSALGAFNVVSTQIVINRKTLRLTAYEDGAKIFQAPVGIGTAANPTPAGHFWIDEAFKVAGNAAYGPFALGTTAAAPNLSDWPGGGVVGIHGTNEPNLIPGRISHGCVRLRNADIIALVGLVPVGTPVLVK
jgi:lipoprotein-anchoring transpeptidase ErfK/SrfK